MCILLRDTCTTVALPYSQLCRLLASRHRHGDTSTASSCAHYLHQWHGAWCIANGASFYLRDSHRVLKLKLHHLDSASEWPKLIMPLAGGQTPERLWPLAILIFRPTHVQMTYTILGCWKLCVLYWPLWTDFATAVCSLQAVLATVCYSGECEAFWQWSALQRGA